MRKRISLFFAALLLCLSVSACSKEKNNTQPEETTVPTETMQLNETQEKRTDSCTTRKLFTSRRYLTDAVWAGEYLVFFNGNPYMSPELLVWDPVQETAAEHTIAGKMCIIGAMETEDGFSVALREDVGTEETPEYHYYFEYFDKNWNVTGREEITEHFGSSVFVRSIILDGSRRYAVHSGYYPSEVTFYDQNFRQLGKAVNTETVQRIFTGGDGRVYTVYQENGFDTTGLISHDSLVMERVEAADMTYYVINAFAGTGKYAVCVYDAGGVYGVDMLAGTCEKLLDWKGTTLGRQDVECGQLMSDGSLLFLSGDGYLVTPRTEEEIAQMTTITLACHANKREQVEEYVRAFNQQSSTVQIELQTTSSYHANEWAEQLMQDVFTAETPDIICTNELDYYALAKDGALEDLYTYMERDPDFTIEDYFTNFFDSLAYDGKLYHLSNSFVLHTIFGKTAWTGEQEGRTTAEYLELIESMPSGMSLFGEECSPFSTLNQLGMLYPELWIDYEHNTNAFNTPEFVRLLEYCRSLPESENWNYYMSPHTSERFLTDEILLAELLLSNPYRYHYELIATLDQEEATLVGMAAPCGGNGAVFLPDETFGISAASQHKEEAWEFIRFLLSELYQAERGSMGLPVHRDLMRHQMENPDDAAYGYGILETASPELAEATQEEMDKLFGYIEQTTVSTLYDRQLTEIVKEELSRFFDGKQTAEETAEHLSERTHERIAMTSPEG